MEVDVNHVVKIHFLMIGFCSAEGVGDVYN